ncbi:MAG: nicotinate-nucleotide adenylyltransferase [Gammaproteobacteria bacterium]|nr:nicotinate-nucleotide adenylyltransferase [Gammaproteobacteria bacterium]
MLEKKVGILGGTFDPIHLGHIRIAQYVFNQFSLKEVRFIPCYDPPHRTPPIASPNARLEMVKIALRDYPYFVLDDREMKRRGKSYMIDTLRSLRTDFPDAPFCSILGYDAFIKLHTWHQWELLKNYTHFVVLNRPNTQLKLPPEMQEFIKHHQTIQWEDLNRNLAGKIYFLTIPDIPISATEIRKQLAKGLKPIGLDNRIYYYIMKHKIY